MKSEIIGFYSLLSWPIGILTEYATAPPQKIQSRTSAPIGHLTPRRLPSPTFINVLDRTSCDQ